MNYFKKEKALLAGKAKRILLAAGMCACLSAMAACASFKTMDEGLAAMSGQPIDAAIGVLGIPSGKMDLSPTQSVYVWDTRSRMALATPHTATTWGSVGYGAGVPYMAQTSWIGVTNVDLQCTVRLMTDNGVITNWTWSGDLGCEQYIDRLKRYLDARKAGMPDQTGQKNYTNDAKSQKTGVFAKGYVSSQSRQNR